MPKIDSFDRSAVRALGAEGAKELKAFADKFGLTVDYAGAKFGPSEATIKFKFGVTATRAVAAGAGAVAHVPMTSDEINFRKYATAYGLEPDDFGREFADHLGRAYKIVGLNPSRHKYPITGRSARGTLYKFPMSTVKSGIRRPVAPKPPAAPTPSAFSLPPAQPSEETIDIAGADW